MEKKTFNPSDWLKKEQPAEEIITEAPTTSADDAEIEFIIKQIEEKKIDIAAAYGEWRNIGFALADAFGDEGRQYFHRISCFYPDYTKHECDTQFDKCLKANGNGITLKTFFFQAKQAGIKINSQQANDVVTNVPGYSVS